MYLVTSREEGGPKALLESMASGIPVVSTRVGMADDLGGPVADMVNGQAIASLAGELLADSAARRDALAHGLETARQHDWSRVSEQLYEKVYATLL